MDPIQFLPHEITDNVLQHFSGNELIALTKVSPLWEEIISSTLHTMKKIKVSIAWEDDVNFTKDHKKAFMRSLRKYQHIDILYHPVTVRSVCEILAAPRSSWRTVHLKRISFISLDEFAKLLKIIEPTIENLNIEGIYIGPSIRPVNIVGLSFPELKLLQITHCQHVLFHEAFSNCRNLKTLVTDSFPSTSMIASIKQILQNNYLDTLLVSSSVFSMLFAEDISQTIKFKLKSFTVSERFGISSNVATISKNFLHFLESQMKSLELIKINRWLGLSNLKAMFCMPKLKFLTISALEDAVTNVEWQNLRLHRNVSIERLCFEDFNMDYSIMKTFIDATPNLASLTMHSMDQQMMEYLSTNASKLTSLSLRTLEATNFDDQNVLSTLTHFKIDVVHADMEDALEAIAMDQRNHLVKLLLESSYTLLH